MNGFFKRLLPASPESFARNRFLRLIQPLVTNPRLWRMRRRAVAGGAAIGVFFAFIIPFGQIPLSVVFASILRMNIPTACLATFVNTPITFAPVYYTAYLLGNWLLGIMPEEKEIIVPDISEELGWFLRVLEWLAELGPALALGTVVLAVAGALLAYLSVHTSWRVSILMRMRRRASRRLRPV